MDRGKSRERSANGTLPCEPCCESGTKRMDEEQTVCGSVDDRCTPKSHASSWLVSKDVVNIQRISRFGRQRREGCAVLSTCDLSRSFVLRALTRGSSSLFFFSSFR